MRALLLDFNGTISDDEPLLCRIFMELFADEKPLSEEEYYERLAGLADREIVQVWLGRDDPALVERKIERYGELADGSTVTQEARDAVAYAAGRVAVAVVSGSARAEIEPVLAQTRAHGVDHRNRRVRRHPAQQARPRGVPDRARPARGRGRRTRPPSRTPRPGSQAAKAAGLYCAAVTTTLPAERLSAADEIAHRFDRDLIAGLLSRS